MVINACLQVGSILFTVVIVTVHLEVASVLDHWTPFHHLAIWLSVCKRLDRDTYCIYVRSGTYKGTPHALTDVSAAT